MNSRFFRLLEASAKDLWNPTEKFGGLLTLWASKTANIQNIDDVRMSTDRMIGAVNKSDHVGFVTSLIEATTKLAKVCQWVNFDEGEQILKDAAQKLSKAGIPLAKKSAEYMKASEKKFF